MWIEYNPNPISRRVEDCSVRAVAKALGWTWEKAYAMSALYGFAMGDMQHGNSVWGAILRENGFNRAVIPNTCPDCYTAEQFCVDHPTGTYVLGFNSHVATVEDGNLYDTWDSSGEIPQYYWYKEN